MSVIITKELKFNVVFFFVLGDSFSIEMSAYLHMLTKQHIRRVLGAANRWLVSQMMIVGQWFIGCLSALLY